MADLNDDPKLIQRRMARIRRELDEEVETAVQQAKDLTDWKNSIRAYPWLAVGAAAALGYLAVPNRAFVMSPDVQTPEKLSRKQKLVVEPKAELQKKSSISSAILTVMASVAVKSFVAMATQHVNRILTAPPSEPRQHPGQTPVPGRESDVI